MGFNDRQRGQRTGLALHFTVGEFLYVLGVHTSSTLEQTGVQVEHVARVGFTAWWTTQQQGYLTVGPSLLGQVVINDQGVFATITEVFTHGATGVRSQILHGGGLGSRGGHNNRVLQSTVLFQLAHHVADRGGFLAHGNVNTFNAIALLSNDGVHSHGSLAGLTVTNDQLALTTANWHHGVHGFRAGLHRLRDGLTGNNARSHFLDDVSHLGVNRAFAVDRHTQGINHTTQQFGADGHFQNTTSGFN